MPINFCDHKIDLCIEQVHNVIYPVFNSVDRNRIIIQALRNFKHCNIYILLKTWVSKINPTMFLYSPIRKWYCALLHCKRFDLALIFSVLINFCCHKMKQYTNCSCISSMDLAEDPLFFDDEAEGSAVAGDCGESCSEFYVFAVFLAALIFTYLLTGTPRVNVALRYGVRV